jgi:hypothetical protein
MTEDMTVPSRLDDERRDVMMALDDVSAMPRLKGFGCGLTRIAAELGCSRNTVLHWVAWGEWRRCASPSRSKKLDSLSEWLSARFRQHVGNADVAATSWTRPTQPALWPTRTGLRVVIATRIYTADDLRLGGAPREPSERISAPT